MTGPRFPYVQFALQVGQHSYDGEALIDTGFDGGFAVPLSLLQDVGPPVSYVLWDHDTLRQSRNVWTRP